MKINVHNNHMKIIDFLDNDVPGSIKYSDEEFIRNLEGGSSSFDFTISKYLNGKLHPRLGNIQDYSFFSFIEDNQPYLYSVKVMDDSDYKCSFKCELMTSELLTEKMSAFEAKEAYNFDEYISLMNIIGLNRLSIGINQIDKDKKLTLSFSDGDTIVKRLLNLVDEFNGECLFYTDLYNDGSIKQIRVDIYKARNLETGADGIGSDRNDIYLEFGRSLDGLDINTNREEQFTAIRLKDKNGKYFVAKKNIILKNAEGKNEFFIMRNSNTMYAPLAMLQYPSLMKVDECDNWVLNEFTCDFEKYEDLEKYLIFLIKKHAYPKRTYTIDVDGFEVLKRYQVNIGDSIYLRDPNFMSGSLFKARVMSIKKSWTNPSNNKITLSNVQSIKSKLSNDTVSVMNELLEKNQSYSLDIVSTNGVVFKSNDASSVLKLKCYKGTKLLEKSQIVYEVYKGEVEEPTYVDSEIEILASEVQDTLKIRLNALYILEDNRQVATSEVTFTKVFDGENGVDGFSPIYVSIESKNGNIFKNGLVDTILTAKLWQDGREIDQNGSEYIYKWIKANQDGTLDNQWNNAHTNSSKQLIINRSDVFKKATFTCNVERR